MTNFKFLEKKFNSIYGGLVSCEQVLNLATDMCISKCRKMIELGVKYIAEVEGVETHQRNLIELINDKDMCITAEMKGYFHQVRKIGNDAVHNDKLFSIEEAISVLKIVYLIFVYIYENYVYFHEQEEIEEFKVSFYYNPDFDHNKNIVKEADNEKLLKGMRSDNPNPKHEVNKKKFRSDILTDADRERLAIWSEDEEVSKALKKDYDDWKIFLHPKQMKLIERSYSGATLIEGGPGTGKSLVGMYRALELSKTLYKKENGCKILFATFLKNLVVSLEDSIETIFKNEGIENNVVVKGVDRLFLEIIRETNPRLRLFYDLSRDIRIINKDGRLGNRFLEYEYEEVILRRRIDTFEEYRKVNSSLLRDEISEDDLTESWKTLQKIVEKRKNKMNGKELSYLLKERLLSGEIEPRYDSIIVDEAQDLSGIQLEVLALLTKNRRNNLFFLSDPYQRIYNLYDFINESSVDFGIRREMLKINYRTTKQIKDYADNMFEEDDPIQKRFILENLLLGREVKKFKTDVSSVNTRVVEKIKQLLKDYKPHEIAVLAHTNGELTSLKSKALKLGIEINQLKNSTSIIEDSVTLTTFAGSKGLEFKCVLVMMKDQYRIEEGPYDRLENRKIQCQKFVACTRGREKLEIFNIEVGDKKNAV